MRISIGMPAYNEGSRIGATLDAFFAQTLVRQGLSGTPASHAQTSPQTAPLTIELVVAPNGCKDNTADVARAALERGLAQLAALPAEGRPAVRARVHEIAQAGKSNAWNVLVHEQLDQQADVVLMLDSDIGFATHDCLALVVARLLTTPQAFCAVGKPLKDVALKPRKSLADRLSLWASGTTDAGPAAIAGSLYAIRGEVIRRIWMPAGLLTEDGYLRAMLVTEFFTKDQQYHRVVREDRASQVFEAVRSPAGVFRHSKRLLVGARVNAFLYDKLWALPKGTDAGTWVRDQQRQDPAFLRRVVEEGVRPKGWWVMQPGLLTKRIRWIKFQRWPMALLKLPVALALFPFDVAVLLAANRAVRKGELRW